MDPPPKKQHLTQQILMEVAKKEGLRWKYDLAANVSKILFTFYYLLQLPVTIPVLEKATK